MMKTLIEFKPFLVQAIRAGVKTETRRIMKPQPIPATSKLPGFPCDLNQYANALKRAATLGFDKLGVDGLMDGLLFPRMPFGDVGSILGVIETHRIVEFNTKFVDVQFKDGQTIRVDVNERIATAMSKRETIGDWTVGRFMMRDFCREHIMVVSYKPQRLLDIDDESSIAEGIEPRGDCWRNYLDETQPVKTPRESFLTLWESIHGVGSVVANPYVWALSFVRTKNFDPYQQQ